MSSGIGKSGESRANGFAFWDFRAFHEALDRTGICTRKQKIKRENDRAFSKSPKTNATTPPATEAVAVHGSPSAEIGAFGKTSDRHEKKKEKLRVAGVETGALVSRLSRCLAWSQRPPATRAPRRASRPSRRAPRADSSLRGERVSMSAALGASAARRVPTECPPPTTTWSARAIPSFDGVAGSRAASTTVDARSRRCPSRVTHRVLLVASALASSPRLARTSRAPRVPRRAHAHR